MSISSEKGINEVNSSHGSAKNNLKSLLCLKAIFYMFQIRSARIHVFDLSNRVLSYYWELEFDASNEHLMILELCELKSKIIAKYGILPNARADEVDALLQHINDKHIVISLFGTIKMTLKALSKFTSDDFYSTFHLNVTNHISNNSVEFFEIKDSKTIQVSSLWKNLLQNNNELEREIDRLIEASISNSDIETESFQETDEEAKPKQKRSYTDLDVAENRIAFQLLLDKTSYKCLEEAFSWFDMDEDKYSVMHQAYIDKIKKRSVKAITKEYPYVTTLLLLYTAIYRYSEEEHGGLWLYFFGMDIEYNFQRDVEPVMQCLNTFSKKYGVSKNERNYFQKKNLAIIFSQIFLPEISIKKIYSAIYAYYYKNNRGGRFINPIDFLECNEYRLDKPGQFFLKDDSLIENAFEKMVEAVESSMFGSSTIDSNVLPKRFFSTLEKWKISEKQIIDQQKDEYYIDKPRIYCDVANEHISLYLPKQKDRKYSDGDTGWKLNIDGLIEFVDGRIIRENSGAYLILNESVRLRRFMNLTSEYVYNDKHLKTWEFQLSYNYLLFDNDGMLLTNHTVSRNGAIVGLLKDQLFEGEFIEYRFAVAGWEDYLFYKLNLMDYPDTKIVISNEVTIEIEDKPVVERSNYKFLFEKWETKRFSDSEKVYETFGLINLISPNIDLGSIHVMLQDFAYSESRVEFVEIRQTKPSSIQIDIKEKLPSGAYGIFIKYKNRTIFRENFVIDRETRVTCDEHLTYERKTPFEMIIVPSSDVSIYSSNMDTKVEQQGSQYLVSGLNSSVLKFLYKKANMELMIQKIIQPIKFTLFGLEEYIDEIGHDSKGSELTKELFLSQDIRLEVKNLDYRYDELLFEIQFNDTASGASLGDKRKLQFKESLTWNLKDYKDRLFDFNQMEIILRVSTPFDGILTDIPVLRVKQFIEMKNFVEETRSDCIYVRWDESEINKNKELTFYNVVNPLENAIKVRLEDNEKEIELDLNLFNLGVYVPILDYYKPTSLFDQGEDPWKFFYRNQLKNRFLIKSGSYRGQIEEKTIKIVWGMQKRNFDSVYSLIDTLKLTQKDLQLIYASVLQMKCFCENNKDQDEFIKITYKIMENLFGIYSKEQLLNELVAHNEKMNKEDISFLVTMIISFEKDQKCSDHILDKLIDYDLVSAFVSIENGSGRLSRSMIISCRESFDQELLMPETIRNPQKIYNIIREEMRLISEFWQWIINPKNKKLLMNDYSKAYLFRTFEYEYDISTFKILGQTIDDMIDHMVEPTNHIVSNLPHQWSHRMGVSEDVYSEFNKLLNGNVEIHYKEIVKAAFLAVSKCTVFSDEAYYSLVMKCYLSESKDIFNRYRALIKLIFI